MSNPPPPASVLVLDCGSAACRSAGNYTGVGRATAEPWRTTVDFPAALGHRYQVWAWWTRLAPASPNASDSPPIAIAAQIVGPALGGVPSLASPTGGAALLVYAVWPRLRRPTRRERLSEFA